MTAIRNRRYSVEEDWQEGCPRVGLAEVDGSLLPRKNRVVRRIKPTKSLDTRQVGQNRFRCRHLLHLYA
jgi:hypothetical protein